MRCHPGSWWRTSLVSRCFTSPLSRSTSSEFSLPIGKTSITRQTLVSAMRSLGYNTLELLLTPLQFGVPNSRLRYYFLAKKKPLQFVHAAGEDVDRVWRHVPGQGKDWVDDRFDDPSESDVHIPSLSSYLDNLDEMSDYSIPDKVLYKWGRLFDVIYPSSRRSCCFTRGESRPIPSNLLDNFTHSPPGYTQLVQGAGSIIQMNEDLDVQFFCSYLTCALSADFSG